MFNLVKDPWIPVYSKKSELVSLNGLFENLKKFVSFEGTSIEKISLIRLALCIVQAALKGPVTEKDWKGCKEDIVPVCLKYLKKWESKFSLYGKGAFLQMPWLPELKNKGLDYIQVLFPSGHTLFDHSVMKPAVLKDNEIALHLLVMQQFGVNGGLAHFKEYKWLGKKVAAMTSGENPSTNNILLTVIMGENLLDTIYHNLIPIAWFNSTMRFGRPVWEYDNIAKDGPEYKEIQISYLGNLVPLNRGIVLYQGESKITAVDGIHSMPYPIYHEPMASPKPVKVSKKPKKPSKDDDKPYIACSLYRAGWRELDAILSLPKDTVGGGAWAMRHFDPNKHPSFTVMVVGFASYLATKLGVIEWVFSVPPNFLRETALREYKAFVGVAEECSSKLNQACYVSLNSERSSNKDATKDNILAMMRSTAASEYWPKMEAMASRVIEEINGGATGEDQRSKILQIARDIFNKICPDISINSKVKGLKHLYDGKGSKNGIS